jgi:hypothetical protein
MFWLPGGPEKGLEERFSDPIFRTGGDESSTVPDFCSSFRLRPCLPPPPPQIDRKESSVIVGQCCSMSENFIGLSGMCIYGIRSSEI